MIGLVVCVETFIVGHDLDTTSMVAMSWRDTGRMAGSVTGSKLLCFGTSLVKCGALPKVIKGRTGLRSYNLSLFNGPMASSYFLLKRVLRAGGRPVAIMVDCQEAPAPRAQQDERAESLENNMRQWPELLDLRELADLSWTARDADFFATVLLAKTLPSYKSRYEIRDWVQTALRGQSSLARKKIEIYRGQVGANRGAVCLQDDASTGPSDRPRTNDPPIARFRRRDWGANRLAYTYSERFLRLAAEHQIKVFWLMPPAAPVPQARRNSTGLDDYFTRLARALQSRHPEIVIIDGRRARYAEGVFPDGVHLDGRGAAIWSEDLAEVIAHRLANPNDAARLAVLPEYRRRTADALSEPNGNSSTALRPSGKLRQ